MKVKKKIKKKKKQINLILIINEEITKFGKGKEKELKAFVQKALDDIHQNNWHISEGFMDKLDEIIA